LLQVYDEPPVAVKVALVPGQIVGDVTFITGGATDVGAEPSMALHPCASVTVTTTEPGHNPETFEVVAPVLQL